MQLVAPFTNPVEVFFIINGISMIWVQPGLIWWELGIEVGGVRWGVECQGVDLRSSII